MKLFAVHTNGTLNEKEIKTIESNGNGNNNITIMVTTNGDKSDANEVKKDDTNSVASELSAASLDKNEDDMD